VNRRSGGRCANSAKTTMTSARLFVLILFIEHRRLPSVRHQLVSALRWIRRCLTLICLAALLASVQPS
jgi:hypothetical protein